MPQITQDTHITYIFTDCAGKRLPFTGKSADTAVPQWGRAVESAILCYCHICWDLYFLYIQIKYMAEGAVSYWIGGMSYFLFTEISSARLVRLIKG